MAFVAACGTSGAVLVGTASYAFSDWALNMDAKQVETSNFNSGGFRTYCSGLKGCMLDLNGNYDVGPSSSGGNMALTLGSPYTFTLEVNATVTFIVTANVAKISVTQNVDENAKVKISAQVSGSFTAAIA
jgi:hypothetical protein